MKKSTILSFLFVFVVSGCSTSIYHGKGDYVDSAGKNREILLEWMAQDYWLLDNDVDYGSISLQVECMNDVLLDGTVTQEYGLVFKERSQDFTVVLPMQKIKINNFIICAKFGDKGTLEELDEGDTENLEVYCKAKPGVGEMLPVNQVGYTLSISKNEKKLPPLLCNN